MKLKTAQVFFLLNATEHIMENINFVLFFFGLELWVLLSSLLIKAMLWRGQTNDREQRKGPES